MNPRFWAKETPLAPAIELHGEHIGYAELEARIAQVAFYFRRDVGLEVGDNVAICSTNRLEYLIITWAAERAGVHFTTINTRFTPDEAAYVVNDCGAKVLVCSIEVAELALALVDRTPSVLRRVVIGGALDRHERFEDVTCGDFYDALGPEGQRMLYTSGSTSRPKGIKLQIDRRAMTPTRVRSLIGEVLDEEVHVTAGSVFLVVPPLYHSAPVVWSMEVQRRGACVVLEKRFDPEGFLRTIERRRITHTYMVPTMMSRLVKLPGDVRAQYDLSSLRSILHAAAPCPAELKRAMIDWLGPIVSEVYGQTEGFGGTYIGPDEALTHPGSVGRARGCEIHILGQDGQELEPGEVGVVWFSAPGGGPNPTRIEYHRDAEETARAYDPRTGWATVRDAGWLDPNGFLYLTGRTKNTIISGGINISPLEVEEVLVAHPEVLDAIVVGIPDPDWGEAVHAVVQLTPAAGATGDAERLVEFCSERLAGFKCPKEVTVVAELPRDGSGKLRRDEVDRMLEDLGLRPA